MLSGLLSSKVSIFPKNLVFFKTQYGIWGFSRNENVAFIEKECFFFYKSPVCYKKNFGFQENFHLES